MIRVFQEAPNGTLGVMSVSGSLSNLARMVTGYCDRDHSNHNQGGNLNLLIMISIYRMQPHEFYKISLSFP